MSHIEFIISVLDAEERTCRRMLIHHEGRAEADGLGCTKHQHEATYWNGRLSRVQEALAWIKEATQ